MAYVIICAQFGMELIGVKSPLINWKMIMKANITKILCNMVDDLLATTTPSPDITRLKRMTAR